ncbi:serine/threonine-protein kinase [Actinophytocola sp.]|uniref:serine/threonine-protein kinase n=1 Tax=Actinophytocola sp. TaxID=1872138 RepID=UPI002ED15F51
MAEPGVRIVAGRYRLLARLGQGGMGVVWRAHDELLRRDVAVKELHVRVGAGPDDLSAQRVLREAQAAARLRHPGVVAVHDVILDDGRPLIVMELVEGRSLAQVIRAEGPLPEPRVAEIGLRVLRALEAAHRHGILHRDVKPANILIEGDRVVLTDFGIAAMTGEVTLTDSRAVLGSPEYLAPERINGQPATPATDLWSLGVTLCAALRGESPFQRSDTQSTLAAVLMYEPPPIPRAPHLWPLLSALLNKKPDARPSAEEAAASLAGLLGVPFEASVTVPVALQVTDLVALPVTEPVATRTRRRGRRLAMVVAASVLAVAAAAWFVFSPGGDTPNGAGARSTTATVPAPPGFTGYRGDGFTITVPKGWLKDSYDSEVYWSSSADSENSLVVHITWWDEQPKNALDTLTEFEQTEFTTLDIYSRYQRIKLVETAAPTGATRAELEATYHVTVPEGQLDVHDLLHAIVTKSGRTYLLTLAAQTVDPTATEQLWQANQSELQTVLESFRVTS